MAEHTDEHHVDHRFTVKIVIGMFAGILFGLLLKWLPLSDTIRTFIVVDVLNVGGTLFINIIKMMVVPIVLVSLVCGSSSLGDLKQFGRVGLKTVGLYLLTTALAIALALFVASLFNVGHGLALKTTAKFDPSATVSLRQVIIGLVPSNPFQALMQGKMLQIIVFSILFGVAITASGKAGKKVVDFFQAANAVMMKLVTMIMQTAPYGVFCLLGALFAKVGFGLIVELLGYFLVVLLVLALQLFGVYSLFLNVLARLNPVTFFRKMYNAMLFAFSVSSSNASIPIVLRTVEKKLGVGNPIASFVIPLGSTINMDGTAIMQGVATVFIAHAYGIPLGLTSYLTVILMATLASIGTAGVPSVGLITLAMVLSQVGLPVQGIALIIGVDRLLDMARTAVNISGDSMIACIVGKSEREFDMAAFQDVE